MLHAHFPLRPSMTLTDPPRKKKRKLIMEQIYAGSPSHRIIQVIKEDETETDYDELLVTATVVNTDTEASFTVSLRAANVEGDIGSLTYVSLLPLFDPEMNSESVYTETVVVTLLEDGVAVQEDTFSFGPYTAGMGPFGYSIE
ncbi:MAG: hypothetical protein OHK0039_18640 [Bacteroidia bacterium]